VNEYQMADFTGHKIIVALVMLQRLGELLYGRRNERHLRKNGGVEHGMTHYPLMVALHCGWLLALALLVARDTSVRVPWLIVYIALEGLRLGVMASLGRYWTTRIITLPGVPLVRRGPYRYLRHPNYLVVACEIAILPLVFGAWGLALIFSVLNAGMLWWRIRIENAALEAQRYEIVK